MGDKNRQKHNQSTEEQRRKKEITSTTKSRCAKRVWWIADVKRLIGSLWTEHDDVNGFLAIRKAINDYTERHQKRYKCFYIVPSMHSNRFDASAIDTPSNWRSTNSPSPGTRTSQTAQSELLSKHKSMNRHLVFNELSFHCSFRVLLFCVCMCADDHQFWFIGFTIHE